MQAIGARGPRTFWGSLTGSQKRTVAAMGLVIVALHVVGFVVLIVMVAPRSYSLGASGVFTVGLGLTAWTLGLRTVAIAVLISLVASLIAVLRITGVQPKAAFSTASDTV